MKHPFFADLAPVALLPLVAVTEERRYIPGEVIFRQGSPSDGVYFLDSGVVRLIVRSHTGGAEVAAVKAGDLFGEMGVIDGSPRSADAVAGTLVFTFWVPQKPFRNLLEEMPGPSLRLLELLASRLRHTTQQYVELAGS